MPLRSTPCVSLPPEGAECRGSRPACAGLDGTKSFCFWQWRGLQGFIPLGAAVRAMP